MLCLLFDSPPQEDFFFLVDLENGYIAKLVILENLFLPIAEVSRGEGAALGVVTTDLICAVSFSVGLKRR
ncbi:hypothetical protein QEH53_23720, partial [Pelagicoccus sp. SDUM812002]|nr:hypothetical protein [Pelagicoccus sp. SDUM812002]